MKNNPYSNFKSVPQHSIGHCGRDWAIHVHEKAEKLDCFVTSFLAKTSIILEVLI